ncbi:MAG: tRNA (adenosine(37)-N6)-threonylcarbamoyltransferase complex transferase subunit TsaD [Oscillospiraceae bacterium]|jgi:N6-L-threonylcarbamoyladenine synthase|nr:tRNA (adenosine(37)-N6)-threonylcarbamoyltransferase complex transferase subunit TsaD [Oscillospiraceae bacterium]
MTILGIESSCDETAAAVVVDGRTVRASVVATQIEAHKRFGGVVPEIASRMHCESIVPVVTQALADANVTLADIDAVAVTGAPGLIGALLVGVNFAKGLSMAMGLPLVPVHHLRGHVASNFLTNPDLAPPFLALIASGGHSHIVRVTGYTQYEIIAQTRDDAAGEVMDKVARALGLPYPGGVHMDVTAQGSNASAYKFPRPRLVDADTGKPSLDFSFSGLKTAALNQINSAKQKNADINIPDFCASFREAVCAYLTEHTLRAAHAGETVVLAGGVCANERLRSMMTDSCQRAGLPLVLPEKRYCGDNAAMIAAQGYYEWQAGHVAGLDFNARAGADICEQ